MGGKYSREVLINRVDLNTKCKIRDYLNSLNLEFDESKDKTNTDTVITIDVSPIIGQKQVLDDLVVFLENERLKIEQRISTQERLGGGSSNPTAPGTPNTPSSISCQYSCFLEDNFRAYSASDTSLDGCMKVSNEGLNEDEETLNAKAEPKSSKGSPLMEMKVASRPPVLPTPPSLECISSEEEHEDDPQPKLSLRAKLESSKKKPSRKFMKIWKGFGKKSEHTTEAMSPEEENSLLKELVGRVPRCDMTTDYTICHMRDDEITPDESEESATLLPPEVRQSIEANLKETIYDEPMVPSRDPSAQSSEPASAKPPPRTLERRAPDCQFQGVIRFERERKCRASKFLDKICRTVSPANPPNTTNANESNKKGSAQEPGPSTASARQNELGSCTEELRTEMIRQKEELAELKVMIKYCVEKLSELTDK